ncbi:MAG: type II toxin-antitoxin system prevent-host-death family antitoxin [Roseateles sp.]|uniref:type II toxin-antitoxin system Phd/YefM family antitoxin n=1 Tax=Roseateles sp. TaxID=1971397 RepID=UPI0039EA067F
MLTLTCSDARARLAELMRLVNDGHAPVRITPRRGKPVVMLSLDEFNALQETSYLMRSPANAARLAESVRQLRSGGD